MNKIVATMTFFNFSFYIIHMSSYGFHSIGSLYKMKKYKQIQIHFHFTIRSIAICYTIYRNYSNLVRILIMQNSAHFGKNGVSNSLREGKKNWCFFTSNLVRICGKKGKFSAHCRRETEKKY